MPPIGSPHYGHVDAWLAIPHHKSMAYAKSGVRKRGFMYLSGDEGMTVPAFEQATDASCKNSMSGEWMS